MKSISADLALIGPELRPIQDVVVKYDQSGVIDVIESSSPVNEGRIILPPLFNAHIHSADIGIRDQIEGSLQEIVGPEGLKHKYLNQTSKSKLHNNIIQASEEAKNNYFLGWIDFREVGLTCNYPLESDEFLSFTRPAPSEFSLLTSDTHLGIRDVRYYSKEEFEILAEYQKKYQFSTHIHASEDPKLRKQWINQYNKTDIGWILDLINIDSIIHGTYARSQDMEYMKEKEVNLVICPSANKFFNLNLPPVNKFLEHGISMALGTDNALTGPIDFTNDFQILLKMGIPPLEILRMATTNGFDLIDGAYSLEKGAEHFLSIQLGKHIEEQPLEFLLENWKDLDINWIGK